jgi:hypothetical protein
MRNLSEEYYWFLTFVVGLLLVALGAAIYSWDSRDADTEKMKACVAAGKDWVRTDGFSAYYECR